jgi:hypothetical protein
MTFPRTWQVWSAVVVSYENCDIMLDDPHLAGHHATIEIGAKGRLTMRAEKSINGVWANIRSVTLTNLCFFRCGEQVFRFEVP